MRTMNFYTKAKIRRHLGSLGIALLCFLPTQAFALDLEFYTWGGFEIIDDAFRRLGLIFSDNLFLRSVAAMAIMGIVFGFSTYYLRGLSGGQIDFRAIAIPTLAGIVLFNALIIPTGSITVYDPTKNKVSLAPIPVPDAIVLIAGGLNLLQRAIRTVVDTGSAYPYASEAGGISYELIYRATAEFTDVDDYYLTKSVGQYYSDCAPPALASGSYGPNYQDLKRNSTNLLDQLSDMQNAAVYTTMYTAALKDGRTVSCTDAWTIWLNPILSNATTYDTAIAGVCGKSGFNPGDAQQMVACRDLLGRALDNYGIVGGTAVQFIRNVYLAQSIDRALQNAPDGGQQAVANRNLMVQGVGIGQTANEWLPYIYAVIYALALGMIPMIALFLVTPLAKQAVLFTVGLFGWLALWSISDMVTHKMAVDGSTSFFLQAAQYQWGLDAVWLSPEASAKAMGLFGRIRSMGVMVATVLAFGLYKWGGYALANMSEQFSNSIQVTGSDAAMRTNTPEGRAQMMRDMEQAAAKHEQRLGWDFDSNSKAAVMGMSSAGARGGALYDRLAHQGGGFNGGGGSPGGFKRSMDNLGQMEAGKVSGELAGLRSQAAFMTGNPNPTSEQIGDVAERMSMVDTAIQAQSQHSQMQAFKQLGNGDFNKGVALYAVNDALSKTSATQTQTELAQAVQNTHNQFNPEHKIGLPQAYHMLQQVREGGTFADINTYQADPNQKIDSLTTLGNYNQGEMNALQTTGARFAMSAEQLGGVVGQWRAYEITGQNRTIEDIPESQLVAAATYQIEQSTLDNAEKMQMTRYMAALNDDGVLQTMDNVSRARAGQELGLFSSLTAIADRSGMDVRTLATKDAGASVTIPIGSEREFQQMAPMLRQHGLLNPAQESVIADHGYTGTMRLSIDPENQQPLTMDYQSGSGVSIYSKTSDEQSVRVSRDNTFDGSAAAAMLDGKGSASVWTNTMRVMSEDWRDGHWDKPESRAFFEGVNKLYAPFGSVQDDHYEQSQVEGGIGASASAGVAGPGTGPTGSASVSGNIGWSGSDTDSEHHSYNSLTGLYSDVITRTMRSMETDMINEGTWGTPRTTDFQNELIRRATPEIQKFHEIIRGNFHHNANEALQNGNDLANKVNEEFERMEARRSSGSWTPPGGSGLSGGAEKKSPLTGESTAVVSTQYAADEFRHYSASASEQSMKHLFGADIPDPAIDRMRTAVAQGEFAEPSIRVDDSRLKGHMAAYDSATQEILISSQLAQEAQGSPEGAMKLQAVISEEYGHHVDYQLRNVYSDVGGDAPRDEGAMYVRELLHDNPQAQSLVDRYFNDDAVQRDGKSGSLEFAEAHDHEQMQAQSYENLRKDDEPTDVRRERENQLYYGNLARDLSQLRDAGGQKQITSMLNGLLDADPELRNQLAQSEYGKALMAREGLDTFQFTPKMVDDLTHHGINALFETKFGRGISKEQLQQYQAVHHSDSPTSTFDPNNPSAFDNQSGIASYLTRNQRDEGYLQSELQELHAALKRGDQKAADEHFGNIAHNDQDMFFHTNNLRLDLINQGQEHVLPYAPQVKTQSGQRYAEVSGAFSSVDMGYSVAPIAANTLFSTNNEAQHMDKTQQEAMMRGMKALFPDIPPEQFDKAFTNAAPYVSTYMDAKEWVHEHASWLSAPIEWVTTPINEAGNWGVRTAAEFIPLVQNANFEIGKDNPTHSQLTFDHKDGTGHELAYLLAQEHTQELMDQYLKLEAWYKTPEHLRTGEPPDLNAVINKAYSHPNDYSHIAHSPAAQQWIKDHPEDIERMGYYSGYGQFVADMTNDPVRGLAAEQALFAKIRDSGRTAQQYIDNPSLFLDDAADAFKHSGDYYDSAKQHLQEQLNLKGNDPSSTESREASPR